MWQPHLCHMSKIQCTSPALTTPPTPTGDGDRHRDTRGDAGQTRGAAREHARRRLAIGGLQPRRPQCPRGAFPPTPMVGRCIRVELLEHLPPVGPAGKQRRQRSGQLEGLGKGGKIGKGGKLREGLGFTPLALQRSLEKLLARLSPHLSSS